MASTTGPQRTRGPDGPGGAPGLRTRLLAVLVATLAVLMAAVAPASAAPEVPASGEALLQEASPTTSGTHTIDTIDEAEGGIEPRIVGGLPSTDLAHQVLVSRNSTGLCGGTLIHPRWVLTAAHCVDGGIDHVRVGVGSSDVDAAWSSGITVPRSAVIVHPQWDASTFRNDVALIRLPSPLRLAPLRVADSRDAAEGAYAAGRLHLISGWGDRVEDDPTFEPWLRWAEVPIVADATCAQPSWYGNAFHAAEMVCAGFAEGGVDSCQGDSGGPMWRSDLLVGIVSWGSGCARPNRPGLYTRVSTYADWIRSHVGPPHNDALAMAHVLACPVGTVAMGTAFASSEPDEPAHGGDAAESSVWFRRSFTAPGTLTVTTNGSTFDTTLGIYTGASPGSLVTVAANDDDPGPSAGSSSAVRDLPVSSGTTYRIGVDGSGREQGLLQLNWFTAGVQAFGDVAAPHPFRTPIESVAHAGITTGYADCTFRPGAPVTRGPMAAFLHRFAGFPAHTSGSAPFPDVASNYDFQREIAWMVDEGYTDGYPDGTFHPTAPVTRQATAAFLHRMAGSPTVAIPGPSGRFRDVPATHRFAQPIYWMAATGLTSGYADGTFHPGATVSRQAMAAFLSRFAP